VHPLSRHRIAAGESGLVLGYAAHPPDRLREAAKRIAAALATPSPKEWHQRRRFRVRGTDP
jgi:GntR family transcriptional regulator/MocR family aminotransferase